MEGDVAGEHLEQHHPQRVQVRLPGDGLPERLLGRDVVGGAEHAPGDRQPFLCERARDPKVRDLGSAFLADQHVVGLDVAMHDLALVGGAERARDLDRVGDRLRDVERPFAADDVLEVLAFDVLEDYVRRADPAVNAARRGLLAGVDHGDHVWVAELRHRARLPAKALELVEVGGDLAVHQLDRHRALEHRVERAVDRRHPAPPDYGVKPVAPADYGAEDLHPPLYL